MIINIASQFFYKHVYFLFIYLSGIQLKFYLGLSLPVFHLR